MPRTAQIAAILLLALTAAGAGRLTAPAPAPTPVDPSRAPVDSAAAPAWREALSAARATAGSDALRTRSHEVLNSAEAELALADAIELLGWTGTDADAEWLSSIANSRDPALEGAAVQALGRLGTDAAVDALLALEADSRLAGSALAALGTTGNPRAFAVLVDRLDHPQYSGSAAQALARYGTPTAARKVADALKGARASQVPALAMALAQFPGEEPRQMLYDQLTAGSRFQRDAALAALARVRDPMVYELLLADLQSGSAQRKAQAAWHLGTLGDPRAVHALHNAALSGSRDLQSASVTALGQIDTKASRSVLLELVEVGPEQVANQAAWAVPHVEREDAVEALTRAWHRRSWNVRYAVAHRLFNASWRVGEVPEAVLALARAELEDLPPGGNTQAPAFLLDHGTPADMAAVEALLSDGPTQARIRVVQALADWPGPAADRLLMGRLADNDANVRDAAVRALMGRGVSADLLTGPLLERLAEGGVTNGQLEQVLVELGTPDALAAVTARLTSGTVREQSSAIQALAWSGEASAIDVLRRSAAEKEDPNQRRQIYQALMWSPSGTDDDFVTTLMDDDDPGIRSMAVQVLSQSGPAARDQLLALSEEPDNEVRMQALSALGNVGGPEAEARLIEALDDPELGSSALSGLSQLGTRGAKRALLEAAAGHDDPMVRTSAIHQLAWTQTDGAQDVLTQALNEDEPSVRQAALSALEQVGTTRAAETLAAALDDEDDQTAQQAAYALQRMGGPVAASHRALIEEHTQPSDLDSGHVEFNGGFADYEDW